MTKGGVIVIGVFLASVIGSAVSFLLGSRSVGNWVAAPSLVLSAWAAFGHLVTLDDDMPGEWSNPQRSRSIWLKSLGQLAIKFAVFAGLLWFIISQQASAGQI